MNNLWREERRGGLGVFGGIGVSWKRIEGTKGTFTKRRHLPGPGWGSPSLCFSPLKGFESTARGELIISTKLSVSMGGRFTSESPVAFTVIETEDKEVRGSL